MKLTPLLIIAAAAASCSSPPKPPTVDDSNRRPINNPQTVDLHRCSGELQATKIALTEAVYRANMAVTGATAEAMAAAQRAAQSCPSFPAAPDKRDTLGSNQVFVVPFQLASATWNLPHDQAQRLAKAIAAAELVVVRGRTDALADAPSETALAKRRAQAAGDWLVRNGLPAQRLRLQWQGAGDPLASAEPRHPIQRRVEIEVYASTPRLETLNNGAF